MEYYSAKGKRRRAEQQLLSASDQTTTCKTSSRDMKSLEVSTTTTINTSLLAKTSYDDDSEMSLVLKYTEQVLLHKDIVSSNSRSRYHLHKQQLDVSLLN